MKKPKEIGWTSLDIDTGYWVNWIKIGRRIHCMYGGPTRRKARCRQNIHVVWHMDETGEELRKAILARPKSLKQLPWEGLRIFE